MVGVSQSLYWKSLPCSQTLHKLSAARCFIFGSMFFLIRTQTLNVWLWCMICSGSLYIAERYCRVQNNTNSATYNPLKLIEVLGGGNKGLGRNFCLLVINLHSSQLRLCCPNLLLHVSYSSFQGGCFFGCQYLLKVVCIGALMIGIIMGKYSLIEMSCTWV